MRTLAGNWKEHPADYARRILDDMHTESMEGRGLAYEELVTSIQNMVNRSMNIMYPRSRLHRFTFTDDRRIHLCNLAGINIDNIEFTRIIMAAIRDRLDDNHFMHEVSRNNDFDVIVTIGRRETV